MIIEAIRAEFLRYKTLAERAIEQLDEGLLARSPAAESNSIATICWHVSGNLRSRFTDFLTSDGEKPWRMRDEEFDPRPVTRDELFGRWQEGWDTLLQALDGLQDTHLAERVRIRGESLSVIEALLRALAHVSSHVGQIVYAAKALKGEAWTTLSIPRGQSAQYKPPSPG